MSDLFSEISWTHINTCLLLVHTSNGLCQWNNLKLKLILSWTVPGHLLLLHSDLMETLSFHLSLTFQVLRQFFPEYISHPPFAFYWTKALINTHSSFNLWSESQIPWANLLSFYRHIINIFFTITTPSLILDHFSISPL